MPYTILELYSGIGGMHCAWKESGLDGQVVMAVDVNTVANSVYSHNFPKTKLLCRNIQSLTSEEITHLQVDTILMSPPCQPFTRNGNCLDTEDARTSSFLHLLNILKDVDTVKYILLENVKGFENSKARDQFVVMITECGFESQEFLLNPNQMGIPNSRLRYYCIAKKSPCTWPFKRKNEINYQLNDVNGLPYKLEVIMEKEFDNKYYLADKHLKGGNALDICFPLSRRSCCFTKAYTHYLNGTGSVYTTFDEEFKEESFKKANKYKVGSEEYINALKPLRLRFFTPKEVSRIMHFPEEYTFPHYIMQKQCYRLLGNSINVKVVSELIKVMLHD